MKIARIKTRFWVEALIRRAELGLAAAYVIRHGDEDAGIVLVKVALLDGTARLYVPARDENGAPVWQCSRDAPVAEVEIDAYCSRRAERDPDLWLIEIEDREGRHFLTEPVENS
jgi:hypothetical protein